ncbi:uncharacterized protein LOC132788731 [Drosophila nasuta]|uniref:Uncharacterized protein LOC117571956 n=1 Tax=Drosophila albomicans TaxID=7291 RepID=A0A6P8XFT1_DROAB|nr:uncharacterized protein LOC117571956 [Drosophila albomicans]XP_060652266.1 uncharacterized protein LOC132788731 [Drosophila nasuta]
MSRQLRFSIQPPPPPSSLPSSDSDDSHSDLVEINLNGGLGLGQAKQQSAQALDELLQARTGANLPLHRGYPYGYGDTDNETDYYFCKKSNSTGQLAEKVSPPPPSATNISCLRQMYCPECHERLHEQGVRLERLLQLCCFALLPIYPCCLRRSKDDCKVICGKCGYLLGAWKRQ